MMNMDYFDKDEDGEFISTPLKMKTFPAENFFLASVEQNSQNWDQENSNGFCWLRDFLGRWRLPHYQRRRPL